MTRWTCLWTVAITLSLSPASQETRRTENVVLITLDGARNQEVFGGLDLEILRSVTRRGEVEDTPSYRKYWAPTPEARREKLMPFFWGTWMREHGSIAGNRERGSTVRLTNGHRFSYPGYAELLTGQAHDDVIDSNDKRRIPFPTVLEFLRSRLGVAPDGVAAFASWDVMDWIVESREGSIVSNAGYERYTHPDPVIRSLGELQFETITPWNGARSDAYTFRFAMAHLETHAPRVLFIALDETDDWAHDRRYDRVLEALERTDRYLRELWLYLESRDRYRGKTSIVVTVDHGRGVTAEDWGDHGRKVEEAQYIWLAVISPDSRLRGEWSDAETITLSQVAATLCRFLGLDYLEQNPAAGKPIERIFPGSSP